MASSSDGVRAETGEGSDGRQTKAKAQGKHKHKHATQVPVVKAKPHAGQPLTTSASPTRVGAR